MRGDIVRDVNSTPQAHYDITELLCAYANSLPKRPVTMRPDLNGILCCPTTHRALKPVSAATLAAVNRAIESASVRTVDGELCDLPLAAGLITDDDRLLYRVESGIPMLLEGQAIRLDELGV